MLLSIIIPVYNTEKYITRCLESLKLSKYDHLIEAIVINDGSTDSSLEIVESYEKTNSNIRILNQSNMGLSVSRNRGIIAALGEFIIFLDSDDFLDIDVAMKAVQISKSNNLDITNYQILEYHSDDRIVEGRYSVSEQIKKRASRIVTGPQYFDISARTGHHIVSACSRIYRTAYLQENNIVFFEGILNEDDEYYPRVFASAKRVMFVGMPCYYRTFRGDSITTSESLSQKRFEGLCVGAFNLLYLISCSPFKTKYIKRYINSMIRAALREPFLASLTGLERIKLALAYRFNRIFISAVSPDVILIIMEIVMGYRFMVEMKAVIGKVVKR